MATRLQGDPPPYPYELPAGRKPEVEPPLDETALILGCPLKPHLA